MLCQTVWPLGLWRSVQSVRLGSLSTGLWFILCTFTCLYTFLTNSTYTVNGQYNRHGFYHWDLQMCWWTHSSTCVYIVGKLVKYKECYIIFFAVDMVTSVLVVSLSGPNVCTSPKLPKGKHSKYHQNTMMWTTCKLWLNMICTVCINIVFCLLVWWCSVFLMFNIYMYIHFRKKYKYKKRERVFPANAPSSSASFDSVDSG